MCIFRYLCINAFYVDDKVISKNGFSKLLGSKDHYLDLNLFGNFLYSV